jgi:hypothetical protein
MTKLKMEDLLKKHGHDFTCRSGFGFGDDSACGGDKKGTGKGCGFAVGAGTISDQNSATFRDDIYNGGGYGGGYGGIEGFGNHNGQDSFDYFGYGQRTGLFGTEDGRGIG